MLGLFLALQLLRISPSEPGTEYRQPQLAVSGDRVSVTFGEGNTVYFASSHDGARRFSTPVKVAFEEKLMLGRHRGPRIAATSGAIVISAIGGRGDLLAWRSTDDGRTWSKGVAINDAPGAAREGLHAMAAGERGLMFAAWLDLRDKGTRIRGAASSDGGATWSPNALVYASPDGHTCECCHPSVAIDGKGRVYVMFRNWLGGARDMYLAVSSDGGKTFGAARKLGEGTWPLNACPMDGGGLSADSDGPFTAWRRGSGIYEARPGSSERKLGEGKDPAAAAGYTAWSAASGIVLLRPGASEPVPLGPGAYVQLAGEGPVYAAWENGGSIQVERVTR